MSENLKVRKAIESSGLIGSVIVLLGIFVFSVITPGYSTLNQTVSELGAKGATNAAFFNAVLTIGLIFLIISSLAFVFKNNIFAKISGYLVIAAIFLIIVMAWFFPMDQWTGVRTPADELHSSIVTYAVEIFLISQIIAIKYFNEIKKYNMQNITIALFAIGLFFGMLSLVAHINQSELINIAERGWMAAFIVYFAFIPKSLAKI